MKFIVNSSELLKELQKLSGVLSSGNTLPILDNFLFEIEEGNINIIASDLETTMSTNINADTTASRIAVSLAAHKIIFMTDVDGVLKKRKLIAQLTASEAKKLIQQKVISGGMAPKIEAGLFCVNNGVESAQIINGTDSHSVIAELFTDKGIGTKIVL